MNAFSDTLTAARVVGFALVALAIAAVAKAQSATVHLPKPAARPAPEPSLDEEAMLWAIRQVESGGRTDKIGSHGERSAYQFMPAVWKFHTKAPFEDATRVPGIADVIARRHLKQLKKEMAITGLLWRPEFIAAAWHHGSPSAAGHVRDDDAQRAAVLYRERMAHKEAAR